MAPKWLRRARPFARIIAFRQRAAPKATEQPFIARGEGMAELSEEKIRYFRNVVADVRVGGDSLPEDEHRDLIERRKATRHSRWRSATLS
jgi:hypothetical protein